MKIKVFGKAGCAKCETTKNKITHFLQKNNCTDKASIVFYDMETTDGLAEGSFCDVLKIPTTVIEKENRTIWRFDGDVPKTEDFKAYFE